MHSQKQDIESSLGFAQISIRSDKKNRASRRKLLFQLWLNEGHSRISLHPLLYSFLVLASRINFESFPLKHRQKRSNRWRILASFPFVPRYDTSHLIERNVFPRFYRGMDTVSLVSFLPSFLVSCLANFPSIRPFLFSRFTIVKNIPGESEMRGVRKRWKQLHGLG